MGVAIPSILVRTKEEAKRQIALVKGLVDTVQLDAVDGMFAGPATWPYAGAGIDAFSAGDEDIHDLGDVRYEIDLMVGNPRRAMGAFLKAGAGKLLIHVESTGKLDELIDELEGTYGRDKELSPDLLSLGLAIHIDTDLSVLEPHLPRIDYVQFMGIANVGKQGQPFDERVLPKLTEFTKRHPEVRAQVDGGVSLKTAPALLSAGADRLVVGSALWKSPDLAETLRAFEKVAEEYGRYR